MGEHVNNLRQSLGLRMLKSMDPDVQEIIFKSNFVTLYVMKDSGWEKADVEGPFFIVSRTGSNKFGFIILNKKSENHVSQHIKPNLKVVHEDNFIFYRNNKSNALFGIWHFDQKESTKCYETLVSCIDHTDADFKHDLRLDQVKKANQSIPSPDYKKSGKELLRIAKANSNAATANSLCSEWAEQALDEFKFGNGPPWYNLSKDDIKSAVFEALEISNFFSKFFEILERNAKH